MSGLRTGGLLMAVLAAGIVVAPAAQAELLEVDLNTPGDALVTRDTDTSLDWLDLTESTDLSFDQVEADVGGFIADGWRHAAGPEVCDLYQKMGAVLVPCPDGSLLIPPGDPTIPFALLGVTFDSGVQIILQAGMYDDADIVTTTVGLGTVFIAGAGTGGISVFDNEVPSDEPDLFGLSSTGHFLVRPSPVAMPIGPYSRAALLILLALTGLVMVRRRSSTS